MTAQSSTGLNWKDTQASDGDLGSGAAGFVLDPVKLLERLKRGFAMTMTMNP